MQLSIFTLWSPGSYGDQTRRQILPHSTPVFIPTNSEIVTSVIQYNGIGIVPVSNPYWGSVNESWETLEKYREKLIIAGSHILPLDHAIVQRTEHVWNEIRRIFSHPQAYHQSKIILDTTHPGHQFRESKSTIGALDMIESGDDAAICSAGAIRWNPLLREQYQVAQENISPADNATKFVVITTKESVSGVTHLPPSDIEILKVMLSDQPGQLWEATTLLGNSGVNIHEWDKAKTVPGVSPLYTLLLITSRLPKDRVLLQKFHIKTITQKEEL
jgi:prephenate dehydratase